MAQPPSYNREHNFVLDEEGSVNSTALNAELDNASTSINKIRDNLSKIQNDDGSLRPGIVGLDALGNEVVKDVAESTERAAEAAAITLKQAVAVSEKIAQIDEKITENANSVSLMKGSVDESEKQVTRLALQVDSFSDELVTVSENIEAIQTIGALQDELISIASDLHGFPIQEFDGGEIDDEDQPMNGIGGVLRICAENIDVIRQVAESLQNAEALMNLAETVDEIGSTDYVGIDNSGETGA